MKKFMVLGCTTLAGYENLKSITEEQKNEMKVTWTKWKEDMEDRVIDMGSPLMKGTKLDSYNNLVKTEKDISGYMMVYAPSPEDAFEMILKSPLNDYGPGNTFEIFECFDMVE